MIPEEVFHYTKYEIALEAILYTQKLQLGQIGLTNDPYETKFCGFAIFGNPKSQNEILEITYEANRIKREEWKVLCVSQNHSDLKPQNSDKPERNHFLYGYTRSRMWAQYAGNHSGICLVFNGTKLDQKINEELSGRCKVFHGSVTYQDILERKSMEATQIDILKIRNKGLAEGLRSHFYEHCDGMFLRKSKDWEAETEYRWLVHNTHNSPEYIDIKGAIKEIIVGVDFPKVYEPSLIELSRNLEIPAGKLNWSSRMPYLSSGSIFQP